jgi:hypothetical protein
LMNKLYTFPMTNTQKTTERNIIEHILQPVLYILHPVPLCTKL